MLEARSSSLSSVLLAPVGDDVSGQTLLRELGNLGMRTDGLLKFTNETSAVCNMVLDSGGSLVGGVADMGINDRMTADEVIFPYFRYCCSSLKMLWLLSRSSINWRGISQTL